MKPQYQAWIVDYLKDTNPYGRCKEAVELMNKAFPELKPVVGHVETLAWGRRGHWWLLDGDEIVDPTQSQFATAALMEYEPFVPGCLIRVGRCMDCGEDIWRPVQSLEGECPHESFCDKECKESFIRHQDGD